MEKKKIFLCLAASENYQYTKLILKGLPVVITEKIEESDLMIVDLLKHHVGFENMNVKYLKPEVPAIILSGQIKDINEGLENYLEEKGVRNNTVILTIPILKTPFQAEVKRILNLN